MGKLFDAISDHHRAWIAEQSLFFVASAPLSADGHVNLSPKGPIGSFAVLDPHTVAYLDVNGSGAETLAHLRENGRIVVMFCAFAGPPRILRLHGRGRAVLRDDPEFDVLLERGGLADPSLPEARRSIVVVDVTRVSDSCGYGVPLMEHVGERDHHPLAMAKRLRTGGQEALRAREAARHKASIDGLPGPFAP
jgi:predicted pyridoxine 5'-phosphate oxidase superfamily flavin-nucleotide-binding protein